MELPAAPRPVPTAVPGRGPAVPRRPALQDTGRRRGWGAQDPRPSPLCLVRRPHPARAREPSSSLRPPRPGSSGLARGQFKPGGAAPSAVLREGGGRRSGGRGTEPRFFGRAGGPCRPLTAAVRSAERHLREGAALGSQNHRGLRTRRAHRVSAARRGAGGRGRVAPAALRAGPSPQQLRLRQAFGDRDLQAGRYRGNVP